jgi:outer membrane protein assembly factor BamB
VRRIFIALAIAACSGTDVNAVPLAKAPWPKFRADARQTGRSNVTPSLTGGASWSFKTQKGVFSSPVVAADGTIYVGSADRNFYAIHPDGTQAWLVATGEIIDSSALLDDRGHIYFGSGDGKLRALDAATGAPIWTMQADDPSVNNAFINWFEGNVAIGPQGMLYVPNDDFFVYGVDRDTGTATFKYKMPDQTWSLPAIDAQSGTFYIGNNNLLPVLGKNTFSIAPDGSSTNWAVASLGTVAASPLLTDTAVIVGGFDGFMHAYSRDDGTELWSMPARDHIYSSPAQTSDGTIIQPSADGTIYAVGQDGKVRWTFDAGTPFRSSPAIDGQDNVYVGGGDGFLYVIDKSGALRWRMKLIDDVRNDLNSSPALGSDAIYIGGESGEVFSVPYDFCLRPMSKSDARCAPMATPADGASLVDDVARGPAPGPSLRGLPRRSRSHRSSLERRSRRRHRASDVSNHRASAFGRRDRSQVAVRNLSAVGPAADDHAELQPDRVRLAPLSLRRRRAHRQSGRRVDDRRHAPRRTSDERP